MKEPTMSPRRAFVLTLLLPVLVSFGAPAARAQEASQPGDSETRIEELAERLRAAEREADRLRRQLVERSHEAAAREGRLQTAKALAEAGRRATAYRIGGSPVFIFGQRARLGITLDQEAKPSAGGAVVDAVLDGGPAEEAGLRAGDVVVRWNDEPLPTSGAEAARRLIDLAGELEAGDEVRLAYRRDGETRTAAVEARKLDPLVVDAGVGIIPGSDELRALLGSRLDRIAPIVAPRIVTPGADSFLVPLRWHRLLDGVEITPLNADLGEYFGTERGLLVLTTPKDDLFGLRAGDVILAVGEREPDDAAHLMRILHSYAAGETINLHVMRKGKRTTLSGSVPERDQAGLAPLVAPRHGI
jgi:predicted metalloprotease with PDZ domain